MNSTHRILFIIAGILIVLFSLTLFLGYVYKDKVQSIVVESLNKNLNAEIEVGSVSFSLIGSFPYAEVEFNKVVAREATGFTTTGTVLSAEKVSLLFSFGSIFSDHYRLKKLLVENATLNLQVDRNGNTNYEIWKKSTDTSSAALVFELENVVFKNVDVLYYNAMKLVDVSFLIKDGTLKGDFKSRQYLLSANSNLENASVIIEDVKYLTNKNCELKLGLDIEKDPGTYTFTKSILKLAGLKLNIDGKITTDNDDLDLDLDIHSPEADLPALLSLIPERYTGKTKEYNYSGKVEFSGNISGRLGKKNTPLVAFSFKSIDVSLSPKSSPYKLTKVSGDGFFTNRKNKSNPVTYLRLEKFSALLEGKPIKADIEIENFNHPRLNISASAQAELEALSKFFMPEPIKQISGFVFVDALFNGIAGEKATYRSSGNIRFENVDFTLNEKPLEFKKFNGLVHLQGNDIMVDGFSGQAGQSDFTLNGTFRNLFAWLLSDNQKLDITAAFLSKNIDLDELMVKDLNVKQSVDTVYRLNFSEKLKFHLDIQVENLKFRKFEASSIKGGVALEFKVLTTRELDFKAAGGNVRIKGSIDDRPTDSLRIHYDALVNNLDINKLFYQMGNFGQQVLMDKNLKGRVSAEVQFRSMWSDQLDINENSIYVKSDITIENGELVNFDPILALARFLKGSDLKTIKFSTLTNTIEIKNRKIFIPMMEIKSSAIDIFASGEHSFDNIVDYKLRLYLSQIMGKKVKSLNTEFGTIEDDGLGRPMIFLTMKGPAADPKFAWDRGSVEKKIAEEIKSETKTIKQILKEEFGRKDTLKPRNEAKKKNEELQIDFDDTEE